MGLLARASLVGADVLGAAAYVASARRARPGLSVLCYHRVRDDIAGSRSLDLQNVTPARFGEQLDAIARADVEVVGMPQVVAWLDNGAPFGESFVAFTFDDGVADQVTAAEMLAERGWTGTFYVPTTHGDGTIGDVDVARLLALGMDVQPHGHAHQPLGPLPRLAMADDVERSIAEIRNRTGAEPNSFAYPYGNTELGHVTDTVVAVMHDSGIRVGLTTDAGNNPFDRIVADPLRLRRITMTQHDRGVLAAAKASGYCGPVAAMKSLRRRVARA